ncbi:hypothetical protein Tco_0717706 [Tanacetum coccineum]
MTSISPSPRRRQPQVRQTSVESSNLEKPDNPPIVTMADNRTMAQLLEAPTEGYEDAIVIPEITANNFEIKHGLLNLVQNKQFFGNDKEDPHAHIHETSACWSSSTQQFSSGCCELKDHCSDEALILEERTKTPSSLIEKAVFETKLCNMWWEDHSYQNCTRNPNPEPNVAPDVAPVPKASISFPSRRNDEKRKEKASDQNEKFYEIFRDLSFEISFTDALMLMPKFASTLKTLIGNKEKLSELARTPLNENCSAVILNKLPKKLGDPGRFLIPCEFTGITTCNALADLGASDMCLNTHTIFHIKRT